MIKKIYYFCISYIISFLEVQLFISLASLPFFIAWGLPVSLITIIGNFIFTPVLTLFLFLCCIITVCEYIHIPSFFFVQCLEYISQLYLLLLQYAPLKNPLIGFTLQSIFLWGTICSIALYFIIKKKFNLLLVLFISNSILYTSSFYFRPSQTWIHKKKLHITYWQGKIYCFSTGSLSPKRNFSSFFSYTLLPEIIKNFGHPYIDVLIMYSLSYSNIEYLKNQNNIHIKTIYSFKTPEHLYKKLQKICSKKNILLLPLQKNSLLCSSS